MLTPLGMFYMQSKSWLSFQRKMETSKGRSNMTTIFGVDKIPTDNLVREMVDKVDPYLLQPVYDDVLKLAHKHGVVKKFTVMGDYLLVTLDGTHYHSSKKIKCDCCQTKTSSQTGDIHYFHSAITPAIVHPDMKKVLPLMQEFISNTDGSEKQDCEVNAAKRWLEKYKVLNGFKIIVMGDDLYASEPMIQAVLGKKHSYIFICKEDSHKTLYAYVNIIKNLGNIDTVTKKVKVKNKYQTEIYNYVNKVPIKSGENALDTNWCEVIITDNKTKEKIYHNCFVTDIEITDKNVVDIASYGRARWKIENENNNTLKTKGYNLEHNFGHGDKYLSQTLCSLNILTYLFHTMQEFIDEQYIYLRSLAGTRMEFFEELRAVSTYIVFKNFESMLAWMIKSRQTDGNVDLTPYI
jgi:Fe2+ or Zn2+ uptake regulation protein